MPELLLHVNRSRLNYHMLLFRTHLLLPWRSLPIIQAEKDAPGDHRGNAGDAWHQTRYSRKSSSGLNMNHSTDV